MDDIIDQDEVVDLIYNISRNVDTEFNKINLIQNYNPAIIGININDKIYQKIYNFKYKLVNINIYIENISHKFNSESNYELHLAISFKTNTNNYYTHYSLLSYLKQQLKTYNDVNFNKSSEQYLLDNEFFIIPFHLTSTYGLDWEQFINKLNLYFINVNNVCSICNINTKNIYSPSENHLNFKICDDPNCEQEFNCQYNPNRNLKLYFINMPQKAILIHNLIHSIINSSRQSIIFKIPNFVNDIQQLKQYFNQPINDTSSDSSGGSTSSVTSGGSSGGASSSIGSGIGFNKYLELLIKSIYKNTDIDSSSETTDMLDNMYNDFTLFKKYRLPYKFIKYFFYKLNKYEFLQCDIKIKHCTIIETKYLTCEDQDTIFKKEINDYAFHGSGLENWFNILVNGLQAGSAAKGTLVNANAYGGGIYISDTPTYSAHYCASRGSSTSLKKIGTTDNSIIMGIFQVADKIATYKKSHSIYVVKDPQQLLLRYLVIIKQSNLHNVASTIHAKFSSTNIKEIEEKTTLLTLKTTNKRLAKEWDRLHKKQKELNITIESIHDNIWNIQFSIKNIRSDSNLYKQLNDKAIQNIQIEITIPTRYPFEAPFIRIVYPRFKFMTGHITRGGSICMELLTNKGWMPTMSIEMLLIQISNLITEGSAELDPSNWNTKYTITEAKEAFARMIKSHGW